MKSEKIITRILPILLLVALLALGSCTHNDNSIGDRATEQWENFVKKDLIGKWNPSVVEVKPLIGKPIFTMDYPVLPNCSADVLELKNDLTGTFSHFEQGCKALDIPFSWSHILLRLSFTLEDGKTFTPILLNKNATTLELAVPVKSLLPLIKEYFPEIDALEEDALDLLFVNIILKK
ncbi:hypothetical protein ACYSNM_11800 [Myroides sp. LJL116]